MAMTAEYRTNNITLSRRAIEAGARVIDAYQTSSAFLAISMAACR